MEFLKKLIELEPFLYDKKNRDEIFFHAVIENFNYQLQNVPEFKRWAELNNIFDSGSIKSLEDLPFLPSSIFKYAVLSSSMSDSKTIKSSGTTSQAKSTIILDKENAKRQTIVLAKILSSILGKKRKSFLIVDIDPKNDYKDNELSARYAGMSGYLIAASKRQYILNSIENKLDLDFETFEDIIKTNELNDEPIVFIGYTYMVFEKLLAVLKKNNHKIKCPDNTIFIHFGGWKKLKDKQVTKKELNNLMSSHLNIKESNIIDIYGFTEQLGTVYPSIGSNGCIVPAYSEVLVRDPQSLKPVQDGDEGFLQFISPIPTSYPGLSILNDDLGRIISRSKKGIQFEVIGRPSDAEPRGCGDTLPENFLI